MAKRIKKIKKPITELSPNRKDIWCIAYINRDFIHRVEEEMKKYGYKIDTYIPTVRVLKKKFKGKDIFEFIPLLFNYGFFKVPYEDACNPDYLMELRNRIGCIYGWVKDPAYTINNPHIRRKDSYDALPASAFASDAEISKLIKTSGEINVYSEEEINKLKVGDYINLKGYPFDNMPAEILNINLHKREIKVSLLLDVVLSKIVTVSFENVFYTVYQGYDDSLSKDLNFDEMDFQKKGSKDRNMYNSDYFDDL